MSNGQWIEGATLDLWEDRHREQIARIQALEAQLAKAAEVVEASGRKRGELEAKLANAVEAVWGEYQDSVTDKWTFRREHIEGAILRSIAAIKGTSND